MKESEKNELACKLAEDLLKQPGCTRKTIFAAWITALSIGGRNPEHGCRALLSRLLHRYDHRYRDRIMAIDCLFSTKKKTLVATATLEEKAVETTA